MNKKKVLIVGGTPAYLAMFVAIGFDLTDSMEEADLVQFTGGEDVTPSLYDQPTYNRTYNNPFRDEKEQKLYAIAKSLGKKCAGICRGGQFLNVMNGGSIYQDVSDHAIGGTHSVVDVDSGMEWQVTSTHHQMMIAGDEGNVLALAHICTNRVAFEEGSFITKEGLCPHGDVEAVMYEDVLCFQPHPEFGGAQECLSLYVNYLNKLFGEEVCAV